MNIAIWLVTAASLFLFACGDDSGSDPSGVAGDSGSSAAGHAGAADAGGGTGGSGGGFGNSGTGGGGFGPSPCGPFGCMCFECAPGCQDCGTGCMCFDGGAPVALPWDPPFDAVGEVGYQDSTQPWCPGLMEIVSLDVWSDARGVFAIVSGFGAGPIGADFGDDDAGVPPVPDDVGPNPMNGFIDRNQIQPRTELWWNDGSSWKVSVDEINQYGRFELTGAPSSVLMTNGESAPEAMQFGLETGFRLCSLGMIDGAGLECLDLDPVSSLYVVGKQRAVAVMGGTRLLLYDGERWRGDTTAVPFPVTEVWADDSNVLALGRAGVVLWREGDGWRLEDPGTLAHITSVWGRSREDIWAGTSDSHVLHYDGVSWTDVAALGGETCDYAPPIMGIWGTGEQVYVHSSTQLARITDGEVETLTNWSCSPNAAPHAMAITGLWGNGPNEIFVSVVDNVRSLNSACGAAHMVYYDGESFHRM